MSARVTRTHAARHTLIAPARSFDGIHHEKPAPNVMSLQTHAGSNPAIASAM
jgi:hypothetical protein